jgi:hypothetical protein
MLYVAKMDSTTESLLNILVISPILLLLNALSFYLFACPCLVSLRAQGGCTREVANSLGFCGVFIALPFICSYIVVLLISALIAHDEGATLQECSNQLAIYAYNVHIVSACMDILLTLTKYLNGRMYITFSFCCIPVLVLGSYFFEKSEFGMVKDRDYVEHIRTYFCIFKVLVRQQKPLGSVGSSESFGRGSEGNDQIELAPAVVPIATIETVA